MAEEQELLKVVSVDSVITNSTESVENNEVVEEVVEESNEDLLQVESQKSSSYKTALDGEVQLMIDEYRDVVRLFQKLPSNVSEKVNLQRRLLARLNNMTVNTSFLANQRDLLKNTIRFQLGIKDRADECFKNIIKTTHYEIIKDDALSSLISFNYNNGEVYRLSSLLNYTNVLSANQLSNIDMIVRSSKGDVTSEESDLLLSMALAPVNMYQHAGYKAKLLNNIQDKVSVEELNKAIDFSFYNNDRTTALTLIRVQIKNNPIDMHTLTVWGERLGTFQKDFVESLRIYQRRSEDYKQYISDYQNEQLASTRGRTFHKRLYAFRGEDKAPYNVSLASQTLDEYLKGEVESYYLEENAKRAFRSFLAFQRYDLVVEYSQQMRDRMQDSVSPYINFWGSYALLKTGVTNEVIPMLGDILTVAPESYCGIVAQKKLKTIFSSSSFSQNRYVDSIKPKSTDDKKALLDYAYISYYLGNRTSKLNAEKIFAEEGLWYPSSKAKLSKDSKDLIDLYSKLNLTKNIRYLIHNQGFTSVYDQDAVLFELYQQDNNLDGIMDIIANGHKLLLNRNVMGINSKTLQSYYPRPYQEEMQYTLQKSDRDMDMYLLYSVMRTESFYKEKARSHAGAMGLMQIMPATGKWLVGKYLPELSVYSIYEPEINVYLGSVYLYDNIDRVGMLPALAAYNSGPTFVNRLIAKYNPKTDLELVEIHPKRETRDYVKKVVESYERYSAIYDNQAIEFLQS